MEQYIKFTVIMAAYNAEEFIRAAIDSVEKQSYGNWELIIVDDGSRDNTPTIIDEYSIQDPRIIAVHQENSGTAAAARTTALERATGEYIQILDSDDMLDKNLLEKYFYKIKETDPDIVVPNCRYFSGQTVYWEKKGFQGDYSAELDGIDSFYYSLNWIIHGLFCAKAQLVKSVGYDKQLLNGDEFTTRKMLYHSTKTVFENGFYYFRKNGNSTTQAKKNMARMFECLISDYNIYRFTLEKEMPRNCVETAYRMLCWSVISHQQKYQREKLNLTDTEKQKISEIIQDIYRKTMKELQARQLNKFSLILLASLGFYKLFCLENAVVSKFRKRL